MKWPTFVGSLACAALLLSGAVASGDVDVHLDTNAQTGGHADPCRHRTPASPATFSHHGVPHDLVWMVSHCPPTAPPTPENLTAATITASSINLSWVILQGTVDHYVVERSLDGLTYSVIQPSTNTLTYTDSTVSSGVVYRYRVRAVDAAGKQSPYSNIVKTSTGGIPDTMAPTVPGNLTYQVVGTTQLTLTWSPSTDAGAVTGYFIERCQSAGCTDFTAIGNVPSGTTTFSNPGLTQGVMYQYRVRASDAAGNLSGYTQPLAASCC